jgi:hypothetical protein
MRTKLDVAGQAATKTRDGAQVMSQVVRGDVIKALGCSVLLTPPRCDGRIRDDISGSSRDLLPVR